MHRWSYLWFCVYVQIETKFRNETRPRQGLLRTKEFLMKGKTHNAITSA